MRRIVSILVALVLALGFNLLMATPVSADVTVTPATGGEAISADTSAGAPGEAWTELGAIVITEGAAGDIPVDTFTLSLPLGFEFDTAAPAPSVTFPPATGLAANLAAITATNITVNVTSASTVPSSLTIGETDHIRVRPTLGAPLASGNITMTAGVIDGIILGVTNFGTLNEVAGALATLTVLVQPTDTPAHAIITPPPEVKATDAFANVIVSDNIAVALIGGPGTLSGTSPQLTNALGIATFDDLSIDTLGPDKQLEFTADGVTTWSALFNIIVGPATQLVITTQPPATTTTSGAVIPGPIVVETQNQYGGLDTNYAGNIVASTDDPGTLTGTLSVAVVLGTATFTDLVYTTTTDREIFQIDFNSGGLTGATSNDLLCLIPRGGGGTLSSSGSGSMNLAPYLDSQGRSIANINLNSTNGMVTIGIPAGTLAFNAQGNPLGNIQIVTLSTPPPPPGYVLVGHAYDCLPDGATFQPAITLTFKYTEADIPDGVSEEDLVLAYWDGSQWVNLTTTVNAVNNTATAEVAHFTPFAILAYLGAPAFVTSDLSITPAEVDIGEEVTISLLVANTGDAAGSYEVTLELDSLAVATEAVTMAAGGSEVVTFTTARDLAGTYAVSVGDLSGAFVVKEAAPPPEATPPEGGEGKPLNPWVVVGIVAAVIVAVLVVIVLGRRRA